MFSSNTSQVSDDKLFVEDAFSTFVYTGNGSTQTITNGIDLAGKEGLLWIKARSNDTSAPDHYLMRKSGSNIVANNSNNTSAQQTVSPYVTFNSNGFYVNAAPGFLNNSSQTYASWTFRKAPKFFDVVTFNCSSSSGTTTINHALGVTPGFVLIKRTDGAQDWYVYHRNLTSNSYYLLLNSTVAEQNDYSTNWTPTSTTFGIKNGLLVNGATYVAYLFAHDATSDGIIQCGSYTGNGSATGPTVTLGWEPQWVLVKNATTGYDWWMLDTMRGFTVPSSNDAYLVPNSSQAEAATQDIMTPTATGFQLATSGPMFNRSGDTFVYIAIRRGPMRTPTTGTSVFTPIATRTATGSTVPPLSFTSNFPVDLAMLGWRDGGISSYQQAIDRLRGQYYLTTSATSAEGATSFKFDSNEGIYVASLGSSSSQNAWMFRRAPSFMDVVCYTGGGTGIYKHNLGAVPELIIEKIRGTTGNWSVNGSVLGNNYLFLNTTAASANAGWSAGYPVYTSTQFSPYSGGIGGNYVAYLFASCPGVSKCLSFTGTGATQTINCGFASGARFILIKRTDAAGDWYTYDSSRGISSANDPYLLLNSTAAEVTSTNWVDTDASGFKLTNAAGNNVNISGASYIAFAVS